MPHSNGHDDPDLKPVDPERFRDDLDALYDTERGVSSDVDRTVMSMAQNHFARTRRARMLLRMVGATAAAASIVLAVWLARSGDPRVDTVAPDAVASREDVDGNGQVDIRDALLLARRIEAGKRPERNWDINGDGIVDHGDVDTVALAAVKLDGGTYQ